MSLSSQHSSAFAGAMSSGGEEDDEHMVIPDLVLFVNGIPLVVMEAKSPLLLEAWRSKAVRQLQRYQEARARVARKRSAGVVPLQPAVCCPLWSRCSLCCCRCTGKHLLRMEIGAAVLRGRSP